MDTQKFSDCVAMVTGGSRGIGLAVARRLAAEGASVAIVSTSQEGADKAAASLNLCEGSRAIGYACDVSSFAAVQALVEKARADFGKIDILGNNAGITRDGLLVRMPEEDWDRVMQVNLKASFNTCKAVMRQMMKARQGRIVNISSVVGLCGNPGQTNYAAAKAGLIGFSKSLAKEVASRNITINVVAPGLIETDMSAALPEETQKALLSNVPLARPGQAEDVAAAVAFLASKDASYITGHVICVDGGMCM